MQLKPELCHPFSCSDLSFVLHWYSCAVLVVKTHKKNRLRGPVSRILFNSSIRLSNIIKSLNWCARFCVQCGSTYGCLASLWTEKFFIQLTCISHLKALSESLENEKTGVWLQSSLTGEINIIKNSKNSRTKMLMLKLKLPPTPGSKR